MNELGALVSNKDLEEWFERERIAGGTVTITFSIEGTPILSTSGFLNEFDIKLEDNNDKLNKALFAAGLYDMRLSITKNNQSHNIATNELDFEKKLFESIGEGILVPDTNILIDHSLSALDLILKQNLFSKIKVMIPRLAILELENIANRGDTGPKRNKAMYGFNEITQLQTNGATLLGLELDRGTQQGFSLMASDKQTDSWIRREIHDLKHRKVKFGYEDEVIFCTSDQVNSLAAIAENLDTLSITKHEHYGNSPTLANKKQLAITAITLSVLLGKVEIKVNKTSGVLTGIWDGKSSTDWIKNNVFYKPDKTP